MALTKLTHTFKKVNYIIVFNNNTIYYCVMLPIFYNATQNIALSRPRFI